jgi:hypothetical protein
MKLHVASEGKYFDAKSMEDTITAFIKLQRNPYDNTN